MAVASAAELKCNYVYSKIVTWTSYECIGSIVTTNSDNTISSVSGAHWDGLTNDDVEKLSFKGEKLNAMPTNVGKWFPNLRRYAVGGINGLASFEQIDFNTLIQLKYFFAADLPQITTIPEDTFLPLTELVELHFISLSNLEGLHNDLLVGATKLERFSAIGPNKITEISAGFFRSQVDSLESVDFRGTNLFRVGYHVFENLNGLKYAAFLEAGCLDRRYQGYDVRALSGDVAKRCQDSVIGSANYMMKKKVKKMSSSSNSNEY